ncbi:MAG: hypothetical protein WC670_03405 [Pseudolabrys sp.]
MRSIRLTAGRWILVALLLAAALAASGSVWASSQFPFDSVLVLDATHIGPLKRVPVITLEGDGMARVDLWCQTVPARFTVDGPAIKVETPPMPEGMPQYMITGQCTDERMQADVALLATLTQATAWQRQGDRVSLLGPDGASPLRFRLSSH